MNVRILTLSALFFFSASPPPVFLPDVSSPFSCVFDRQNRLLVAESTGHDVKRFTLKTGKSEPIWENLGEAVALAADGKTGDIYVVDHQSGDVKKREEKTGKIVTLAGKTDGLREPHDCVLDRRGGLLIADVAAGKLWRFDLKTKKLEIWKDGFRGPRALAVKKEFVYVCEREANKIERISLKDKRVTPVAGTGAAGNSGDGGPASNATFRGPKGICLDSAGNIYVADTENDAVRRIDAKTGVITTFASGLKRPHGVTVGPDGALYIADTENNCIRRVEP